MPAEPRRAKELFAAALDEPDPAARADLLDRECGGDAELRRRVDVLLAARDRPHPALEQPLPAPSDADGDVTRTAPQAGDGPTADHSGPADSAGTLVAGRYKLLEVIGEGGMGSVWMAEQRDPVKRLVAVKLIKAGMDSKAVLARFEAERQALALMDHPNIAKVLDGGTTAGGRPYFVMELVKGLSLTEYCDARRLSVRDRLQLFRQVCSAVQHAHQKGVIHRDLKPSNVLVTEHDGTPVPKVIDFGLAKALSAAGALTDRTLHTAFGSVVGTPLYMAPEQVGINALDVDTRTDIYALGVILYELLTGTTPLEKRRLREAAWDEMRRLIREEEPPRPSVRLSSSDALPSLAAGRQVEPARLTKLVRGELDWIVMKALEKDRNRRYETANGLAMDVERHLAGEAVHAVPPSTAYRLRKAYRRNRGPVLAAGAVLVALLAGLVATSYGFYRADLQRQRAEGAERSAVANALTAMDAAEAEKNAKQDALNQKKEADQQAAIAKAVSDFLQNDLIGQASAHAQPRRDITVREVLDRAAERIDGRFDGQPRTEAAIRDRIADAYESLALRPQMERHGRRALELYRQEFGEDDRRTLVAMQRLALALREQRRFAEAEPLYKKALEIRRRSLDDGHPDVIATLTQLAWIRVEQGRPAEAEADFRSALEWRRRTLGDEHFDTVRSMSLLRAVLKRMGKNAEAAELENEVLRVAPKLLKNLNKDDPKTVQFMVSLMEQLRTQGRLDEAYALGAGAVESARRVLGDSHATTLYILLKYGETLVERAARGPAEWAEAEKFHRDSLAQIDTPEARAASSTFRPWMYRFLAELLSRHPQRYEETLQAFQKAAESWRKLSLESPDFVEAHEQLAHTYRLWGFFEMRHGKHGPASAQFRRALDCLERPATLYPDRIVIWDLLADSSYQLGHLYVKLNQHAEAEKTFRRAVETCEILDARFPHTQRNWAATQWYNYACLYAVGSGKVPDGKQKHADRAMELLRQAVKAGWKNAAHMRKDADLDSLRDREDFKKLLADLEAESRPKKEHAPPPEKR